MPGTLAGGKKAAQTNMKRHGADFYRTIGKKGGQRSRNGGFAYGEIGREKARVAGAKGGRVSKRTKKEE